jgi:protein gp37
MKGMGMNKTTISWCYGPNGEQGYTWNPFTGCSPASEGCENCYAEAIAHRFKQPWRRVTFHPERLTQPYKQKTPARVFVCSVSDIYHESIDPVDRSAVLKVIGDNPHLTFILLTKRPHNIPSCAPWFQNIWLGVTAENQLRYAERWIQLVTRTSTADRPPVRFVSVEPMLGPVIPHSFNGVYPDWIIAGPETGQKKRPCPDRWIDSLGNHSACFHDKRKDWKRRESPR